MPVPSQCKQTKSPLTSTYIHALASFQNYLDKLKGNLAGRGQKVPTELDKISQLLDAKLGPSKENQIPPTPLPPRLAYPPTWKAIRPGTIACAGGSSQIVIIPMAGYRSFISSITFTVAGATNITLEFGEYGASGPMAFGATPLPCAIAQSFGDSPIPVGKGSFIIVSDTSGGDVFGFITYYREKDEPSL